MLKNARKTSEFLFDLVQKKSPSGAIPGVTLFYGTQDYQMIDWKLNGCFSRLVNKGIITGKYGEVTLAPVLWNRYQLSFYIVGMGELQTPDAHLKGIARGF